MKIEIERKFMVDKERLKDICVGAKYVEIIQGYFLSNTTMRIRITENGGAKKSFLTIKDSFGKMSCREFEYKIPVEDAEELLKLCGNRTIKKIRYYIDYMDHTWEVDVFDGRYSGLCFAEVEMEKEDESVSIPPWVGEEITGRKEYKNHYLATH